MTGVVLPFHRKEASPLAATSRPLRTTSGSARAVARWPLLLCDCERVVVTAGGAAGTWDGYARFAGLVSTAGSW